MLNVQIKLRMINLNIPKVSVVTPVFNGSRFIERTLQSVLNQSYPNIEHIVVDGGSTDATLTIVERYKESLALVISEQDRGMYDAINKGFARASGEIFCYLNSDDLFEPDAVALAVDIITKSNADMCVGDCIFIDDNDHELFRYFGVALDYFSVLQLCRMPFSQQTVFWTRRLHEMTKGFDANLRYVGDTKFFFEALRLSGRPPAKVDYFVSRFRQHAGAFSTKQAKAMEEEHMQVLADMGVQPGLMKLLQEIRIKWINRRNIWRRLYRRLG